MEALVGMYDSTVVILERELWKAFYETAIMLVISITFSTVVGMLMGLYLYLTSHEYFNKNKLANNIIGWTVNIIRSIPFIVLVVFSLPLTFLITGSKIGPIAAAVPLSIAATALFARIVESSLRGVNSGVLEAALAQGASNWLIIREVLLVEAAPAIVRGITIITINLIAFSAMAGMVGGGGVGNLAIQYGYYRYETGVMFFIIVTMVIAVQIIQFGGDKIARALEH